MPQSTIENVLLSLGPSPSSKIKKQLITNGLNDAAARQRISRSRGKVRRLTSIGLPKRETFLYLDDQYASNEFWNSLVDAHTQSNSAYGIAIQSLMARGGIIPKEFFKIISGSPEKLKKHVSTETILKGLISTKLVKLELEEDIGECVVIDAQGSLEYTETRSLKSKLIVEDIIINAVYDWARKIGFASYNAIKKRSQGFVPVYGQFGWDITAPSYIYPLSRFENEKLAPGFITIDVVNSIINTNGAKYFIKKCQLNRSIKNMKPFIGMLVADRFSEKAFKLGKSSGVIFTTPDILFGVETADSIRKLSSTLDNAAAIAVKNPDKVISLLNSLSSIEGSAINLRGALFELIIGHLVYKGEGASIDIGVKVKNMNGERAEIDVRRVKGEHELAIYECKGYQPTTLITLDEINQWLTKKIPIIRSALKEENRFKDIKMSFEYWTSGEFSDEAIDLLKKKNLEIKKYNINWKNGKDIVKYARDIKSTSMVDTLNQHYARHPLS